MASANVRKSAALLRSPAPLGAAWDVSLVVLNIGILACSYVSPLPCSLGAEFTRPFGTAELFQTATAAAILWNVELATSKVSTCGPPSITLARILATCGYVARL